MPLDPSSGWPFFDDAWPTIDPDQPLGETGEEGDLLVTKIMAAIAAMQTDIGNAVDLPDGKIRTGLWGKLTDWTPTAFGINGLSCPSNWIGKYTRIGSRLSMFAAGRVTADWSGPAGTSFLELGLPPGMKAIGTGTILETCRGGAYVQSMPAIGVHWEARAVCHPGANRLRFIHPSVVTVSGQSVLSPLVLAANFVQVPGPVTGDGTIGNQDIVCVAVDLHVEDA